MSGFITRMVDALFAGERHPMNTLKPSGEPISTHSETESESTVVNVLPDGSTVVDVVEEDMSVTDRLTDEQKSQLVELFSPEEDKREGKTRLTVRFDPATLSVYRGDSKYRTAGTKLRGATVLRYVEEPARTPTGGRYTRRGITVRTSDGRRWYGTLKAGTDVVKLRLAPKDEQGANG